MKIVACNILDSVTCPRDVWSESYDPIKPAKVHLCVSVKSDQSATSWAGRIFDSFFLYFSHSGPCPGVRCSKSHRFVIGPLLYVKYIPIGLIFQAAFSMVIQADR